MIDKDAESANGATFLRNIASRVAAVRPMNGSRWAGIIAAMLPFTALAHHGTSITYDITRTITISGTVTEFYFGYPHVQIYLDRINNAGAVEKWGIEMAPTPAMLRQLKVGWTRNTIKRGDNITIVCNPHKVRDATACLALQLEVNGGMLPITPKQLSAASRSSAAPHP